jgi:hypothetical protein
MGGAGHARPRYRADNETTLATTDRPGSDAGHHEAGHLSQEFKPSLVCLAYDGDV